jgi:hypothetical protein
MTAHGQTYNAAMPEFFCHSRSCLLQDSYSVPTAACLINSVLAAPLFFRRADLDRLVVAGHSRGGKLAALHYSSGSVAGLPIRSAFLIDPVDNTA